MKTIEINITCDIEDYLDPFGVALTITKDVAERIDQYYPGAVHQRGLQAGVIRERKETP